MVQTERRAIFVLMVEGPALVELGLNSIAAYAAKYGIDLIIRRERHYSLPNLYDGVVPMEKLAICDLFQGYDRVLNLDSDILVTEHAPNIFDFHQNLGAIVGLEESLFDSVCLTTIPAILAACGGEWPGYEHPLGGTAKRYQNTGVTLYSAAHSRIFAFMKDNLLIFRTKIAAIHWPEQTWHNWVVHHLGLETEELDYRFNYLLGFANTRYARHLTGDRWFKERFNSFFVHYTGDNVVERRRQLMETDYQDSRVLK